MNPWEQNIYEAGRAARNLSIAKRACPHGMAKMRERHWWLVRWLDQSPEQGGHG